MNTNSYFTIQVLTAGTVIIQLANATGTENPGTIYYWINSVPNAARDNYDGSIVPDSNAQYIRVNSANPTVGTIIRLYRPETTACCFGDGGDNGSYIRIHGTAETKISGNMASLIGFNETIPAACFRYLFYSSAIVDASELELPWLTLSPYCFVKMFYNNQKLIKVPYLPATTVADYCYTYMFRSCAALKTIAKMGVQTITCNNAFGEMYALSGIETVTIPKMHFNNGRMTGFMRNCTSLKTATVDTYDETLPNNVYQHLFRGCTGLETITCKAKSFNSNYTFADWVLDVPATGTFIKDKDTTWPTGNSGIPTGWNVKNTNQNTQFLDFSSADRIMYNGNNHIKCIYGPNNQLLWTEEQYFTVEATGSGYINLNLVNTGSDAQMESIRYYYWKNTIPNAARDNYDGTLVGGAGNTSDGSRLNYVAGDVIRLYRPEQTAIGNGINNVNRFTGMSNCKIYGNIASLIGYVNELPVNAFAICFYYCQFTECSGLIIPWNTIPQWGMRWMFYGCSSFTDIPFLPATTVGTEGYHQLFRQCRGLVNVDLTQKMCCKSAGASTFQQMFFQTTSLQSIKIPSNIEYTGNAAWNGAFYGCTALNNVTCLDSNPTGNSRFNNWLQNVAATGTFTKAAGVTWPSGVSGIPEGWTVVEQ